MSTKKIKQAFNDFSNDKFLDAEEVLKKVIKKGVNDHLKDKLHLKNDPLIIPDDDGLDDE